MIRLILGSLFLMFGATLVLWIAYNLLIARQEGFHPNVIAILFIAGLFYVGAKWVYEGWQDVEEKFRKKKRRKKKRLVD